MTPEQFVEFLSQNGIFVQRTDPVVIDCGKFSVYNYSKIINVEPGSDNALDVGYTLKLPTLESDSIKWIIIARYAKGLQHVAGLYIATHGDRYYFLRSIMDTPPNELTEFSLSTKYVPHVGLCDVLEEPIWSYDMLQKAIIGGHIRSRYYYADTKVEIVAKDMSEDEFNDKYRNIGPPTLFMYPVVCYLQPYLIFITKDLIKDM